MCVCVCIFLGEFSTALYDFDGQDGELSFKVKSKLECFRPACLPVFIPSPSLPPSLPPFQEGDKIKVVYRVNKEWLKGEFAGAKGMFPANFVDPVPSDLPEETKEKESEEVRGGEF